MAEQQPTHQEPKPLTDAQLAAVEHARNVTPVISRTYRRTTDPAEGWTFESMIVLADDVDIVELLKREREQRTTRLIRGASE